MKTTLYALLFISFCTGYAQVGIGTTNPDASSILDITSTNTGILIPRLTETQRTDITNPANGLLVYQTDNINTGFWYYNGTAWTHLNVNRGEFESIGGIVRNTSNINSDCFVFGSTQMDDLEGTADNHRMFFDKTNGSFRAGRATGTQWNAAQRGYQSLAMGFNNTASANYSTAFGYGNAALGNASTALGVGNYARSYSETVLGTYNTNYIPNSPNSWNNSDRLLVVGNGNSDANRSDAFTILKSGNVGIGTSTPETTLDVHGTFKYTDGNELLGKVLTSDNEGNATWQPLYNHRLFVKGNSLAIPISTGNYINTGSYIVLPPGRWAVTVNFVIYCSQVLPQNRTLWLRSSFTELNQASVTYNQLSNDLFYEGAYQVSGIVSSSSNLGTASGTLIIENSSDTDKTYYYVAGNISQMGSGTPLPAINILYGQGGEDLIIAYKLN